MLIIVTSEPEDTREYLIWLIAKSEIGDTASTTAIHDIVDQIIERYDLTPKRSFLQKLIRRTLALGSRR